MKSEIQKSFGDVTESFLAESRAVVSVAIKRGWIRFAAPKSPDAATDHKETKKRAAVKRRA